MSKNILIMLLRVLLSMGLCHLMVKKKICGPGTSIYIPSLEPHGMKNTTDEPATFLCCICNVYDEEETL